MKNTIREQCGLKDDVVTRIGKGILRMIGHKDDFFIC